MAREKKSIHRVQMTDGKRSIIQKTLLGLQMIDSIMYFTK